MLPGRSGFWLSAVIIGVLILLPAGCSEKEAEYKAVKTIRISGAEAVYPLIEVLAGDFQKNHKGYKIVIEKPVHTPGAIQGVKDHLLDIGFLTRDLTEDEKNKGIECRKLADDGIAVVVSKDVNISHITGEQLRAIYKGDITNWNDISGYDKPVIVLDRPDDKSAKKTFRMTVLGKDLRVTEKVVALVYEDEMVEAVRTTEGAIGYFSLGYATLKKIEVNILEIDGVKPSVENIRQNNYRLIRPFCVVVRKPPGAAKEFFDYLLEKDTKILLENSGYAP